MTYADTPQTFGECLGLTLRCAQLGISVAFRNRNAGWEVIAKMSNGAPTGQVLIVCFDRALLEQCRQEASTIAIVDQTPQPPAAQGSFIVLGPRT